MQLDLTDAAMEADIEAQALAAAFVDAPPAPVPTTISDGPGTMAAGNGAPGNGAAGSDSSGNSGTVAMTASDVQTAAMQTMLADKMGDAPLCDTCGHITIRNGSCYRCLNCGDSKGCS